MERALKKIRKEKQLDQMAYLRKYGSAGWSGTELSDGGTKRCHGSRADAR